ncbi:uncharacterized protein LOC120331093 [Styela clava]
MSWFRKNLSRKTKKSVASNKTKDQGCSENQEQSGFEISDQNHNKWIRDEHLKEHGHISVKNDSSKNHFWKIDRTSSQNEPSWTFASPSADGQLYVTYNMDEEVTMEKQGEKEINFTMLLQADGKLLFRAESSPNRYLVQNREGQLEMKTTDNPTDEMEWMISYIEPSLEKPSLASSYSAQIRHGTESKKWLSSGPANNYHVQQVQTSATQNWTITPSTGHIFQFSSGRCHITKDLIFGDSSNAAKFESTKSGSGVTLQCTDNRKYIHGPEDDGDLELNTAKSKATVWEMPIKNAIFIVCKNILLSETPIQLPMDV